MITLYHYPSSPCAAKVRAVLTEKRLTWESRIVNILEKENLAPDYLKLHPKGVVPVLIDGDHVVIESTIIMEYLDTAFEPDSLKPPGAYAQTRMRKWLKWVDESLHPNWAGLGWTILIRPTWLGKSETEVQELLAKLIDPARRERQERIFRLGYAAPEFRSSLAMLEKTLADMEEVLTREEWLAGDRPSLGDIAVLPYVISAEKFGIAEMMLEQRAGVRRWLQAWRRRPTYAETMPWDLPEALVNEASNKSVQPWQAIRHG